MWTELLTVDVTDKGCVCVLEQEEHNTIHESCLSEIENISIASKIGLFMSLELKSLEVLMCFHGI